MLATVLFTDIVGSTEKARAARRPRAGASCSSATTRIVRRELLRFRGRELDTAGDGFFAAFDGPARAIRCACAIVDGARASSASRFGPGCTPANASSSTARSRGSPSTPVRVSPRRRGPGEVLVSSTVKDLVAGSGIRFADRGVRELAGVPGDWHLFAVEEI